MTQRLVRVGFDTLVKRVSSGLVVAVLASGCAAPPKAQFPSARATIDRLRESTECSRALQGEANLSFAGDGRRLRGKILYLVHAPNQIRFDVFSPFGMTLSTLTSDGRNFGLYSLEERLFLYGSASTCNVERFTQVPVPPSVLVELLRGRPPVLAHEPASADLRFRRKPLARGHYVVEIAGSHESVQRLEIGVAPDDWNAPLDQQRLRLLGVEVAQAGQVLYQAELGQYQQVEWKAPEPDPEALAMGIVPLPPSGPVCHAEVPGKIRFYVPETGHELSFVNKELLHNPPLAPNTFSQAVPAGVVARESRCAD